MGSTPESLETLNSHKVDRSFLFHKLLVSNLSRAMGEWFN